MNPFLIILSAPSGSGKTTIAHALADARDDIAFSISATTRSPRKGERDGVDYHFLGTAEFESSVEAGKFLEYATYGGEFYGTLEAGVDEILATGKHAVLDIEVQGAAMVRERREDVVSIFILPPTADALVNRLGGRNTETPRELRKRLLTAVGELREAVCYDYVVINVDRDQAVAEVASIVDAEARKPHRLEDLQGLLDRLSSGLAREADKLSAE